MCGVVGIFSYLTAARPVDITELITIRDYMKPRGPDGRNHWTSDDKRVGLGHRRLSIIDLSDAGVQPMASIDGKLVITFNGEIYNYLELRQQLISRGYTFRSQSDTEVLLHLYADKGDDMFRHLRGMFAFGLWDNDRQSLLLARDPYGIKPLYYSDNGKAVRFASQVKALMAGGAIPTDPDPVGWSGFFMFGSVPEPYTTYKAVRSIPAGSFMRITQSGADKIKRYHSISSIYRQVEVEAEHDRLDTVELQHRVRTAALDSVKHHLVSDVPVGAFLSGGIDSGALVGLMRDAGYVDLQTVTLAFEEFVGSSSDESPVAAEVAKTYNTRHTVRVITQNEFHDDLRAFFKAMDQPTIDGINTWFVSKAAQELGIKVAISGVGGDEIFGGYPSFSDLPRLVANFKLFNGLPALGKGVRKIVSRFDTTRFGVSPKAAGLAEMGGSYAGAYFLRRAIFMPWELDAILEPELAQEALRSFSPIQLIERELTPEPRLAFHKVSTLESSLYMRNQLLRDTDWTSMAHSLEVRTPLVDAILLDQLAPLGKGLSTLQNKQVLRDCPRTPLPDSINRPKTGFTVPMDRWMKQMNAPALEAIMSDVPLGSHWSRRWALAVQALFDHGEAML